MAVLVQAGARHVELLQLCHGDQLAQAHQRQIRGVQDGVAAGHQQGSGDIDADINVDNIYLIYPDVSTQLST